MPEPTLTAVFGANAVQDISTLTISKTDLVAVGLTAAANNSAEALLTAIVKLASGTLSEENRDSNIDQSVAVVQSTIPSFTSRINGTTTETYIRDTFSVELDKAYTATAIDPDDY
ncbi:hypothetical protein H6G36_02320 [Anabaena minutissima FACHB-250]|nr:hypothetical protein [Anabaena minutissima FACHB-250]